MESLLLWHPLKKTCKEICSVLSSSLPLFVAEKSFFFISVVYEVLNIKSKAKAEEKDVETQIASQTLY